MSKKIKTEPPKKFFYGDLSVDKDIKRYRKQEKELREKIEILEKLPKTKDNLIMLTTYQSFLRQLLESKELLANRIGKK